MYQNRVFTSILYIVALESPRKYFVQVDIFNKDAGCQSLSTTSLKLEKDSSVCFAENLQDFSEQLFYQALFWASRVAAWLAPVIGTYLS